MMQQQGSRSPRQRYHVAIIAYDEPFNPPAWVGKELDRANIDFSMANCLTEEQVIDFACDKDILLTSSARKLLTRYVIEHLNACRAVVRAGSGVDCIEIPAATERGIVVVNTPEVLAEEVSDHAAALLLDCVRRITSQDRRVKQGLWRSLTLPSGQRIRGKTLGLIGFGRIARTLVEKLSGFNLTYLAYDPYINVSVTDPWDVRMVGLDELLMEADLISLHVPLSQETYHLLGERELRLMKRHAILINTARGAVVDQTALYKALTEGWIAGAGLDVLEQEPPSPDDPLLQLENVVITPHTAAASDELMDALYRAACRAAIDLLNRKWPASIVNPEVQPWWTGEER